MVRLYFIPLISILLSVVFFSCSGSKKLVNENDETPAELSFGQHLQNEIDSSQTINSSLVGICFYDADEDSLIWQLNYDKYFTPASNTKILSFYCSNSILTDSIIAYKYNLHQDTLVIQATGDPSFLHHYSSSSIPAYKRLKDHEGHIKLYLGNYEDKAFGSGWAWDDYPYYYQPEKSPFPIYGNTIRFQKQSIDSVVSISPSILKSKVNYISDSTSRTFQRDFGSNQWIINSEKLKGRDLDYEIPFKYNEALELLLKDTISQNIAIEKGNPPHPLNQKQTSVSKREMLQWMMEESDNFYAEQLLLMSSNTLFDTMQVSKAISFCRDTIFHDKPDTIRWVDGSGLSRYNLITPRSLIYVLKKYMDENSEEDVRYYYPKIDWVKGQEVFAKTGSLSNNRCLSGYLYTKSGKKLIFSIMVNHYMMPTREVNRDIAKLLQVFGNHY